MINEAEIREELVKMSHDQLLEAALKDRIELQRILEQLATMQRQKYSHKSEGIHPEQLALFNEMEDILDHATEEELIEKPVETKKKKIRTVKQKEADYSNLPSKTIHHDREDKKCPECGTSLKELKPTIKYELKYTPARYEIIKHVQHNYVCPNEDKHETMKHVESNMEGFHRLIEGSVASPSVIAGIATNKFVLDIPLYRQESDLKRQGVPISRQNMSNWLIRCGEDYLESVFNAMWEDLKELNYLHMDETTLVVLETMKQENRKKNYIWLAMSGRSEEEQMALYFYRDNHRYENVEQIVGKDKEGYIHSDGYKSYQNKKFTNVACMAHVRRKFFEALSADEIYKKYEKSTIEEKKKILEANPSLQNELHIMKIIQDMFKLDKTEENRKEMKEKKMKPLYDELFTCIKELGFQYIRKGKLGTAIHYALELEEELRNYLKDENLEISNNRALFSTNYYPQILH